MNLELGPFPNDGINLHIMACARKCQIAGLSSGEAESRIMAFQGTTRRPIKHSEVQRAILKVYSTNLPDNPNFRKPEKAKWEPLKTRKTTYRAVPKGITAYDLWEASPDRIDEGMTQDIILSWLFPDPEGLVCIGMTTFKFRTARLKDFTRLEECQFIVPCFMSKVRGLTQDGKESMHCLDNCGPRRFCVCDFDEPKSSDHPAIIWQLKKTFDLVMVLSSGNKSLHAWFCVPEDEEEDFWARAIPLGADPALMRNRSSFVRLPYGTRENGKRQMPIYLDQSKLPQ